MVKLYVSNGTLEVTKPERLTTNAINAYEAEIEFASDWSGYKKTAVFYQTTRGKRFYVDIINNTVLLPATVLENNLPVYLGLVGIKSNVKKTSNFVKLEIAEGADIADTDTSFVQTVDTKILFIRLKDEAFQYSTDGSEWKVIDATSKTTINGKDVPVVNKATSILTDENYIDYKPETDGEPNKLTLSDKVITDIATAKTDIEQAKTDITDLNTEIGKTNTALSQTNTELGELQTAIGETNSALEEVENTVNNHTNEIDTLKNGKLDKSGGSITGNLAVQGDLTVSGTTKTEHVEQLAVDKPVIIVNGNKVDLQAVLAGLAINKNSSYTYGIMYDPSDDTVKFGVGTVDEEERFTFNAGEGQALGTRADSSQFTNAHLVKWNAEKNMFEDAGVAASSFVEKQTGTTSYDQVYGKAKDGTQKMFNADGNASASTVAIRTGRGTIIANAATSDVELVNKGQLDDAIASLDTKTDNKTITKNASGELQAVSLTDGTDILSYSDILQAMTIERL